MSANIIFVIILVVVVVILVVWIVTISRRARAVTSASNARLEEQLRSVAENLPPAKSFADETPAERSAAVVAAGEDPNLVPEDATPALTKADRLGELGELHAKGLISDDELAAARAKILAE